MMPGEIITSILVLSQKLVVQNTGTGWYLVSNFIPVYEFVSSSPLRVFCWGPRL